MRRILSSIAVLVLASPSAGTSANADIIYNRVDVPIDNNTISGTITTDGTTGTLAKSDILAWQYTATGT
jgi:hypothetical protein